MLRERTGNAAVHVTSPPIGANETGVLSVDGNGARLYRTPRISNVPNGVGDVFSGLVASGAAPGLALGHLDALVRESAGAGHLAIVPKAALWKGAAPISPEALA